jgi:hypothetical protein
LGILSLFAGAISNRVSRVPRKMIFFCLSA